MITLEDALDDCVAGLENGQTSLEECLARYPEYAAELRSMLMVGPSFSAARVVTAPAAFKTRNRAQLIAHIGEHSRGRKKAQPSILARLFQGGFRTAFSLGVVAVALVGISTAAAQSAVPGQPLYSLKRASEGAWRLVTPDPLSVDIALTERRAAELLQVHGSDQESTALQSYQDSLVQVSTYRQPEEQAAIAGALSTQQQTLEQGGVEVPILEDLLGNLQQTLNPTTLLPTLLPTELQIDLPTLEIVVPALASRTPRPRSTTGITKVPTATTIPASPIPQATATPEPILPLPTLELPPVVETLVPPVVSTVAGGVGDVVSTLVPGIDLPLP